MAGTFLETPAGVNIRPRVLHIFPILLLVLISVVFDVTDEQSSSYCESWRLQTLFAPPSQQFLVPLMPHQSWFGAPWFIVAIQVWPHEWQLHGIEAAG